MDNLTLSSKVLSTFADPLYVHALYMLYVLTVPSTQNHNVVICYFSEVEIGMMGVVLAVAGDLSQTSPRTLLS